MTHATVEITVRERYLLEKYLYLSEDVLALLRSSPLVWEMHVFEIDSFWVSQWIGDLAHAGRKSRSSRLREALDELCEVLEGAVRRAEHPRG